MVNESNKTCKFFIFFCVMCVWFIQPIQINNKLISNERNKGLYQIRYAAVNLFFSSCVYHNEALYSAIPLITYSVGFLPLILLYYWFVGIYFIDEYAIWFYYFKLWCNFIFNFVCFVLANCFTNLLLCVFLGVTRHRLNWIA